VNVEEDDSVRPVLEMGDRLGYVHIGENLRGYQNSAHLDFTSFSPAPHDGAFMTNQLTARP
jgi:D-psicose/D-tagatose/L-ribulose 3-epimerase